VDTETQLAESQGMVRDLLALVQKLLLKLDAATAPRQVGKPKAKEPEMPQLSELERVQRAFDLMSRGGRDVHTIGTLHGPDGRSVPVRRIGQAFLL